MESTDWDNSDRVLCPDCKSEGDLNNLPESAAANLRKHASFADEDGRALNATVE